MLNSLDSSSEHFLAAIERTQERLSAASRRVASGKRVVSASDAPDEISDLLQLKADQRHNTRVQANLGIAKTNAVAADLALDASVKLLDRARVLGAQASNPLIDASGRQTLAEEVLALQEQLVTYSRTEVQGRYLFSGDQDHDPQYILDPVAPDGVLQLIDPLATARVEYPTGGSFAATKTAAEIFDSRNPDGTATAENAFAALNSLRLVLLNDDTAALDNAMLALRSASHHLNNMQAFYGAVQNRISYATDFAASHDIELRTELSQKEDADVAAAAVEVTQTTTQLQAAFQIRGQLPRTSLFDFLG
jgi:flagellar hook-associated protein 3 FlgL